MAVSSRFRVAALALVATLLTGLFVVLLARDGADAAPGPGTGQTRYLLRLTDLPPGFVVLPIGSLGEGDERPGPDMPCGELDPADPAPKLAAFIRKHHPAGCFAAYVRLYAPPVPGPKPLLAGSGVLDLGSVAGAREAFALAPQILGHFFLEGEIPGTLPSPEPVGEESVIVPWPEAPLFRDGESGTYVLWRSGDVVGVVLATGRSMAAAERDALALARLQQARIEHPAPYTAAERDDAEVALDNPKLARPVYWLGRELAPRNALPPLRLDGSAADPARGIFQNVYLGYRAAGNSRNRLDLAVYTQTYWRLRGDSLPSPGRCARTKRIALPEGRAVIYGAYKGPTPTCPEHPPGVFFARAFIGHTVITADLIATCPNCGGPGGGPYNSLRGMTRIVRALELRPKVVF
jgi:hypothetical protein